jgi:arginine decarboxylase
MSHGVDTRNRAWKVQATAQELFAEAVGAKQTLFSTNGSSLSARVAIMTVAGPAETLVMARNGRKSAFSGLILSGARPVYVDPGYDDELEIALGPVPDEFARVLDEHPEARAALVFTPSYYGTAADVRGLAEVFHRRGLPLVTDDARLRPVVPSRSPERSPRRGLRSRDRLRPQDPQRALPDISAVGRIRPDRHRAAEVVL